MHRQVSQNDMTHTSGVWGVSPRMVCAPTTRVVSFSALRITSVAVVDYVHLGFLVCSVKIKVN